MTDMKVKVAISNMEVFHKPNSFEYQELYKSFENREIDPVELPIAIIMGNSFSNWTVPGQSRGAHSWQCVQYVGVDLEKHKDALLAKATAHPFYSRYGYLAYTTLSHKPEEPRSRLVFLLDEAVDDVEAWHWGALAIAEMWSPASDMSSADRGRSFLGSPHADMVVNGKFLSTTDFLRLSALRERQYTEIVNKQKQERERRYSSSSGSEFSAEPTYVTLAKWVERVRSAPAGERNAKLNRAAFLAGRYLLPKGMAYSVIEAALIDAGLAAGLTQFECDKTVRSAMNRGRSGS